MFERIHHSERLGVHIANLSSPMTRSQPALRNAFMVLIGVAFTLFLLNG